MEAMGEFIKHVLFSQSLHLQSQNFRDVGYKDTIFSHSVFIMWQAECPEHRFQHEIECYYSCHLSAQGYLKVTTALFLADFEKEEHCLVVQFLKYSVHKCMGTTREEVIHLMRAEFLLGMLIRKPKSILVTLPSIASPTLAFVVTELEGPCLYHWYTFAIQFNPLRPELSLFYSVCSHLFIFCTFVPAEKRLKTLWRNPFITSRYSPPPPPSVFLHS